MIEKISKKMSAQQPIPLYRNQRIAVILPCHNEELTVRPVVEGFRAALPEADIYIFNNVIN